MVPRVPGRDTRRAGRPRCERPAQRLRTNEGLGPRPRRNSREKTAPSPCAAAVRVDSASVNAMRAPRDLGGKRFSRVVKLEEPAREVAWPHVRAVVVDRAAPPSYPYCARRRRLGTPSAKRCMPALTGGRIVAEPRVVRAEVPTSRRAIRGLRYGHSRPVRPPRHRLQHVLRTT